MLPKAVDQLTSEVRSFLSAARDPAHRCGCNRPGGTEQFEGHLTSGPAHANLDKATRSRSIHLCRLGLHASGQKSASRFGLCISLPVFAIRAVVTREQTSDLRCFIAGDVACAVGGINDARLNALQLFVDCSEFLGFRISNHRRQVFSLPTSSHPFHIFPYLC